MKPVASPNFQVQNEPTLSSAQSDQDKQAPKGSVWA
jgi:hypothetical protein